MNEEWKDIKGYEGLYQVSNLGRVKSLERVSIQKHKIKEKIRACNYDKDKYLILNICKDRKTRTFKVHRLVAEAFIPNPDNLPEVNHKDEDKTNNKVDNLEWCNRKYNMNYGTIKQKFIEKRGKKVYQYDLQMNFIKKWNSTRECGKKGFFSSAVSACCLGKLKHYKGFIWSYKNFEENEVNNKNESPIYTK